MDTKKQAICQALRAWINQRPGLEFGNYGDVTSYRAEVRSIGKDLQHARELLRAVELRYSITGDDLAAAFPRAYSGRLSCKVYTPGHHCPRFGHVAGSRAAQKCRICCATGKVTGHIWAVLDYCTGQYWPTEYRRAACAVLASALWDRKREDMPAPQGKLTRKHGPFTTEHDNIEGVTPGDWLRASFRLEFGRSIADRWFA